MPKKENNSNENLEPRKRRNWWAVLYLENMVDDWQNSIGDLLQLPYAYCIHDKDTDTMSEHKKDHVHIIITYNNSTSYSAAYEVFNRLSAPGKRALNKVEGVINIRNAFEYLIHNTEDCKKKEKYLYPVTSRITGNNFDIATLESISAIDKINAVKYLCDLVVNKGITNFQDLYQCVSNLEDSTLYFTCLMSYSGLLDRLISGVYKKKKSIYEKELYSKALESCSPDIEPKI